MGHYAALGMNLVNLPGWHRQPSGLLSCRHQHLLSGHLSWLPSLFVLLYLRCMTFIGALECTVCHNVPAAVAGRFDVAFFSGVSSRFSLSMMPEKSLRFNALTYIDATSSDRILVAARLLNQRCWTSVSACSEV
jgi:hypothetical protein